MVIEAARERARARLAAPGGSGAAALPGASAPASCGGDALCEQLAAAAVAAEKNGGIAWAKRCLQQQQQRRQQQQQQQPGPAAPELWWSKGRAAVPIEQAAGGGVVRVGSGVALVLLRDNARRVGLQDGDGGGGGGGGGFDDFGDNLPTVPVVLTGVADGWAAAADGGWCAAGLAARGCDAGGELCFGVDGGPGWARESLAAPAVTMAAYAEYCRQQQQSQQQQSQQQQQQQQQPGQGVGDGGPGDDAPLYIFDAHLATRTFADGGALRAECAPAPACFGHDAMAGIAHLRPLPPSWLLVAAAHSGTPIHDHPHTVAWNVLLSGCKLWAILPPGARRSRELADDQGSALGWFLRHGGAPLPSGAVVVVQRPGETVFVPAGWWHVVLNCEDSTALSSSLALRRDFRASHAALAAEDPAFAEAWLSSVRQLGWPARFLPRGGGVGEIQAAGSTTRPPEAPPKKKVYS